jgi:hypothetical protein
MSTSKRIAPMIIEWAPGSSVVGDFSLSGFDSDVAVTEPVLRALEPFGGVRAGPVEMTERTDLTPGAASRTRVRLPYRGPTLHELWIDCTVPLDLERSTVRGGPPCGSCGKYKWEPVGVERIDSRWDPTLRRLRSDRVQREPGKGLFVRSVDLAHCGIFRIRLPGGVIVTDEVRNTILQHRFTNVDFLESGEALQESKSRDQARV